MIRYYATGNTLHILAGGKRYSLDAAAEPEKYDDLLERLKNRAITENEIEQQFNPVADVSRRLAADTDSVSVSFHDGYIILTDRDGEDYTLSGMIVDRIKESDVRTGHLTNFLRRCAANARPAAVLELYDFLEATSLPIGPDGHFYAYKKVRRNLTDIHSGTFDNSPGQVVAMPRETVDADRNRTCSTGLHFAGYDYLRHYGSGPGNAIVMVKIDPADVVAIPSDYNNQKGRTSRYEVIAVIGYDDVEPNSRLEIPWYDYDAEESNWPGYGDDEGWPKDDDDVVDDGYYW